MAYTQEGIMAQVWIAFGQGAGAIRVSHDAAMELRRWYYDAITPEVVNEKWQTDAVQALDRIRAIGRLAALKAAGAGSTVIKPAGHLRVGPHGAGRVVHSALPARSGRGSRRLRPPRCGVAA